MNDIVRPPRVNLRCKDLSGLKFGRLRVSSMVGRDEAGNLLWSCQCECGGTAIVPAVNLKQRRKQSCGCLERDSRIKHGMHRTPEYQAWASLIYRCTNPSAAAWRDYDGRGIKVCDRWLNSFEAFIADMGSRPGPGYSIDRIDNDGNYKPDNCRWTTQSQQSRNHRRNRFLTYLGKTLTVRDWAYHVGLSDATLRYRLGAGWSIERALGA